MGIKLADCCYPGMTDADWKELEDMLGRALALDQDERERYVESVTARDATLGSRLRDLLANDSDDEHLKRPIAAIAESLGDAQPDPWEGRCIGAWTIRRRLADGGMGAVFLAERSDHEYAQTVAVKVMTSQLVHRDALARFRAERQILASLSHPHIARLIDAGSTTDNLPYLVMEYVDGEPIDSYCDRHRLDVPTRLALLGKVCGAVDYAHRNLVVHRDLKPNNILIDGDGEPRLLDFGIAKLLENVDHGHTLAMTRAGSRIMTPEYASPEQVRGEPVTVATDVYALGVLLYRLLTGHSPYGDRSESAHGIEQAIIESDPRRPSTVVDTPATGMHDAAPTSPEDAGISRSSSPARLRKLLAGDLDNIVLKTLQKDPERRYASARHLGEDIANYLADRPVLARPESFLYSAGKFLRRNRWPAATAAVFVVTIAGLLAFSAARLAAERDLQAQQRETAQQVSDFMVGLFENADPRSGEGQITARELLEQSIGGIDELREAQPLVAASLMIGMVRAYDGLADFDTAVELAGEALDIRRARLPAGHPDIAEALHYFADAEAGRARYAEARTLYDEALAIRERALGPEALEVGETLYGLSFVHMRLGEYEALREAAERSLAIHEQALGPEHPDTGRLVGRLGDYYWVISDFEAAREYAERNLAIAEDAFGRDSIRSVGPLHRLGLASWALGEYAAAYDLYLRQLTIREAHLGPDHPDLGYPMYGLAITSSDLGNYGEALDWYEHLIRLQETALGPDDHYLALTLSGYGFALLETGQLDQARASLQRALSIFERKFGRAHLELRAPLAGLAKVAIAQERYGEAEALLERAREIVEAQLAPDHDEVLRTIVSIGELYTAKGDYRAAGQRFARGLAGFERTLGLQHPFAAPALAGMATVQTAAGEHEEAEANFARAVSIHESSGNGDRKPALAAVLESYAKLLRVTGRAAEAAQMNARAGRIRDAVAASLAEPVP